MSSRGPKEGDVVVVSEGMPYFVTKRAELKKGIRKLEKKKKRITGRLEATTIEGEEIYLSKEEEKEIKDWERSLREEREEKEHKKTKKKKVRAVEDIPLFGDDEDGEAEGEDEYRDEDDARGDEEDQEGDFGEEDAREEDDQTLGDEDDEQARYEVLEDLVYKKVKIPGNQKEYASKYGINLPEYEFKLLPQKVRRRIRETELRYPIEQRMRVGANGELIPIIDEQRPIKLIGDETVLKPNINFSPPRKVISKANPYDSKYPFGAYVSFVVDRELYKGVVLSFSRWGVNVSVQGRIYQIDYTDPSLQLAERPRRIKEEIKKDVTVEDVYVSGDIPEIFRTLIVDSYISILKNIKESVMPKRDQPQINTSFFQHPPMPWEEYYAKEYRAWIRAHHYMRFFEELDMNYIRQEAARFVEAESSIDGLLRQITDILPNGLWYSTTITEVLETLKEQPNITVFQAHLIIALEKEIIAGGGGYQKYITEYTTAATSSTKGMLTTEKYYRPPGKPAILRTTPPQVEIQKSIEVKPIAGRDLAVIIQNAIESYQRIYQPPDINNTINEIVEISISEKLNAYQPTEEERLEFEIENLVVLTEMHANAEKEYYEEKKKVDAILREEERYQERMTHEIRDMEEQVKKFERLMFAAYGSTVHTYLSNVLLPYIFLDGPLARYAKFFRAKLEIDEFRFDDLGGINLAHYLPELAMNKDLTEKQWDQARNILSSLLDNAMDNLINLYITIHNPMTKIEYRSNIGKTMGLIDSLVSLLKDPREMCPETSGMRPVVKDGRYVYKSGTKERLMEKIPLGEMTICFSDGKFTCHEIRSILRAIAFTDIPINPMTKQPFPESFVEKMKTRYADILASDDLFKEPEEPKTPLVIKSKTPEKPKVSAKIPVKILEAPKKEAKPRHKPPRKAKGKVVKMAVIGDVFDTLTMFENEITTFVISKEKIVQEPRVIPITSDITDDRVNVVVIGFDAKNPSSIEDLKDIKVPDDVFVYVVGVDAKGVASIAKSKMTRQVKKIFSDALQVFYTDSMDSEDLVGVLKDVFIDIEAVKAF